MAQNRAVTVLRWIGFLPAAFVASVIGSFFGTLGGRVVSEFISFTTSGAFAASAFIIVGLIVAPIQSRKIQWVLVAISALLGALSASGSFLGDDKLKAATGISMIFFSFLFLAIPADETRRLVGSESSHPENRS